MLFWKGYDHSSKSNSPSRVEGFFLKAKRIWKATILNKSFKLFRCVNNVVRIYNKNQDLKDSDPKTTTGESKTNPIIFLFVTTWIILFIVYLCAWIYLFTDNLPNLQNMKFLEKYYPILLAFLSFLYSIYLWFSGQQLEGLYVGLWPVTILGFAIAIRQRRKDSK